MCRPTTTTINLSLYEFQCTVLLFIQVRRPIRFSLFFYNVAQNSLADDSHVICCQIIYRNTEINTQENSCKRHVLIATEVDHVVHSASVGPTPNVTDVGLLLCSTALGIPVNTSHACVWRHRSRETPLSGPYSYANRWPAALLKTVISAWRPLTWRGN